MKTIIKTMLFISVLLSGCATAPQVCPDQKVVKVEVPVVQPWPAPPALVRPELEINKLKGDEIQKGDYDKTAKALAITIQQLEDYVLELEKALSVYKTDQK